MAVRITSDQAKLLFGSKPRSSHPGKLNARVKKRKEELPENIVEGQICDFLKLKGWRLYRQHCGAYMPYGAALVAFEQNRSPSGLLVRIGEKGMPDWRAERPIEGLESTGLKPVNTFHFETKAPGEEPKEHQLKWMREANATGTAALWFDSYARFLQWYGRMFPGEVRTA